jgi:phosphatidylinositol phospholipase C delta
MSEAVALSKSPGLMRRLSNRATQLAGRRRQSSNTAMRDHSSGPVIMRRRSDSTNTAPEGGRGALWTESDDDIPWDYREEPISLLNLDSMKDYPSTTASIASTSIPPSPPGSPGPVIPAILLQGTTMVKVTKKKRKHMTFVLDNDSAKVSWDKTRPWKSFYIDDIKDIRVGQNARNYREEFGVSAIDEPRFFTIIYIIPDKSKGRSQKAMHLIARDEQTFELWTTTLDAISKHRQDLMASLSSFHEKAVKSYWRSEMNRQFQDKAHSEEDETIDIVGVERLCRSLHIHGSSNYLRAKFDQADTSRCGRLNYAEFQDFVKYMKQREDVRAIFRELASDVQKGLTLEDFLVFLREIQLEDVESNRSHWEGVFARFARRPRASDSTQQLPSEGDVPCMNEAALANYLISTFNLPMQSQPAEYTFDRPLNEYYISSSHNTYLLGRQVAGQSSVEAYISALNRGCRCVEVDCWNGKDGQPVVMHGHTLTTQVSFADVMSTISKYAFVKSPYPLWVSLEVHCNPQQQALMAEIIKETCGSKLVTQPLDSSVEQLPTPSQLKHRILIKVKKPRLTEEAPLVEQNGRRRGNSLSSPYMRPTQLDNAGINVGLLPANGYPRTGRFVNYNHIKNSGSEGPDSLSSSPSDSESLTEDVNRARDSNRRHKTSNIIKVLGELGVYSAGLKFHGFDTPDSKTYNHIYSFMENTFDKNSKTQEDKRAVTRHNMRHMMRVYPNGWRVASTNFDPLKYWRRGVQMVALNWQTYDLGMQMNDAMFASGTDQSGYVLKPSELREIKMLPNVPEEAGIGHVKRERKNVNFSIDVISAQQLMRPKGLAPHRSVDHSVLVEV